MKTCRLKFSANVIPHYLKSSISYVYAERAKVNVHCRERGDAQPCTSHYSASLPVALRYVFEICRHDFGCPLLTGWGTPTPSPVVDLVYGGHISDGRSSESQWLSTTNSTVTFVTLGHMKSEISCHFCLVWSDWAINWSAVIYKIFQDEHWTGTIEYIHCF